MTKKKKKRDRPRERCAGSSQPPTRRHDVDDGFGWCAECERWRRLIGVDAQRVRVRTHWAPAA